MTGQSLSQPSSHGDIADGNSRKIICQEILRLFPNRSLGANGAERAIVFALLKTFHENYRPLDSFINFFNADPLRRSRQAEAAFGSDIGLNQSSGNQVFHDLGKIVGGYILLLFNVRPANNPSFGLAGKIRQGPDRVIHPTAHVHQGASLPPYFYFLHLIKI